MKENTEELEILAQSVINTEELEILAQSVINGEKIEEVVSNPVIGLLFSVLKSFIPVLDISEPIVQTFFQKREKEKIISLLEGISNALFLIFRGKEEFYPIMQRLLRTGFYRNDLAEVGALDRGADKMGYTTEYFSKFFMKAVGTEEKALQAPRPVLS